jgi:hypothetical protein
MSRCFRGSILDNASQPVGETTNTYCVILCIERLANPICYPSTKRFYLRAATADGTLQTASDDNPHWRVIGIEPRDLFARLLQGDPSRPAPYDWDAA